MAVSVPYLKLCGYVIGGWLLAKSAAIAAGRQRRREREFYAAKIRTARSTPRRCCRMRTLWPASSQGGAASVLGPTRR